MAVQIPTQLSSTSANQRDCQQHHCRGIQKCPRQAAGLLSETVIPRGLPVPAGWQASLQDTPAGQVHCHHGQQQAAEGDGQSDALQGQIAIAIHSSHCQVCHSAAVPAHQP